MATALLVLHVMIAAALIGVILLQRSEGGALGIGGGGAGGFMTGRGTANLLTRMTAGLAAAFVATSIILALLARPSGPASSILEGTSTPPAASVPAPAAGTTPGTPAPAAPAGGEAPKSGGGVLGKLKGSGPSGPAVPKSQ